MPELRLHFTAGDLARTRVAAGPHPMWELVLSVTVVGARRVPGRYTPWRTWAVDRLNRNPDRAGAALLTALAPPEGDFPDFLTPYPAADGFAAMLDTVLSTPAPRMRAELAYCGGAAGPRPTPPRPTRSRPVLRRLAAGGRDGLHALRDAATWYHRTVVEPAWPAIRAAVQADRAVRAHDLTTAGLDQMLTNLPPCVRWTPPMLRADYPEDRDLELDGRGLTLIPAYFCYGKPVALIDPELPPVLVYPLGAPPPREDAPSPEALADLIGATRAQVLRAVAAPRTTTGIAAQVRISPASASKHAAALRAAGLITSVRRANTVLHTITALGASLLKGAGTPEPGDGTPARSARTAAG